MPAASAGLPRNVQSACRAPCESGQEFVCQEDGVRVISCHSCQACRLRHGGPVLSRPPAFRRDFF